MSGVLMLGKQIYVRRQEARQARMVPWLLSDSEALNGVF